MTIGDPLLDEIRNLAANVFNLPVAKVAADATAESVESWDSLRHLNLILAIEEQYGVQIDPWESAELTSIEALVNAVREKRGS